MQTLLHRSQLQRLIARHVAAAVPVQGCEAHQPLQVGLGVDVPLPHGVQLEARPWQHIKVRQEGVQNIWKPHKKKNKKKKKTSQ